MVLNLCSHYFGSYHFIPQCFIYVIYSTDHWTGQPGLMSNYYMLLRTNIKLLCNYSGFMWKIWQYHIIENNGNIAYHLHIQIYYQNKQRTLNSVITVGFYFVKGIWGINFKMKRYKIVEIMFEMNQLQTQIHKPTLISFAMWLWSFFTMK